MSADRPVFVSGGGKRFHSFRYCPALTNGQNLWDGDEVSPRAVREMPRAEALAARKTPCRACLKVDAAR